MTRLLLLALLLWPVSANAKSEKLKAITLIFAGGARGDLHSPALEALKLRLAGVEPKQTVLVFTGNYVRDPIDDDLSSAAEEEVMVHVAATSAFVQRGGRVFFLPGDRDFPRSKSVRRLRSFLNDAYRKVLDQDSDTSEPIDVMPNAECSEWTTLELNDQSALMLLNSQWWVRNWDLDPDANELCGFKARDDFLLFFGNELVGYRGRRLIMASHHPLRSYGAYARWFGLMPQTQNHPFVRSYIDAIIGQTQRVGSFIIVSGHEQSLQLMQVMNQTQIISGALGKKAAHTGKARPGDVAVSSPGWVEITLDEHGEGRARFVGADKTAQVPLPKLQPPAAQPTDVPKPVADGTLVTARYAAGEIWHFGALLQCILGKFHIEAYRLDLPFKAFDLTANGMKVKALGGGMQTNSLKLTDAHGADWSLRRVKKDPNRNFVWPINQVTLLNRLLDHGYLATHPEAALAIPRLAEATGVLHTEPKLVYVADQKALGSFRGMMGNQVALLERRPNEPDEGELPASLVGEASELGPKKYKNWFEMSEKLIDKPDKHRVDQEAMLRARLLDLLVGDWDRHQNNWSFVSTPDKDGTKVYRPIARDRDQAFVRYDGLAIALAKIFVPVVRSFGNFNEHYGDMEWLTKNARNVDPITLNQIPHARWMQVARDFQAALSDDVLDDAFKVWSQKAYEVDGQRIVKALRKRRDDVLMAAEQFYRIVNRRADVVGSMHADTFELFYEEAGAVHVTVKRNKSSVFFDRTFREKETSELRLYALDGADTLIVHGEPNGITVRWVGGKDHDVVRAADAGHSPLRARSIEVYDNLEGVRIDPSIVVSDRRTTIARMNQYDWLENHERDYGTFMPMFMVNPDQGLYLGGSYILTLHGYKKHPYAARHTFTTAFATANFGLVGAYHGIFPQSAGLLDQSVDLEISTPLFTRNFFGVTNRYVEQLPNDQAGLTAGVSPSDYFRLRQGVYLGRYGFSYGFGGDRARIGAQIVGQIIDTQFTTGRFATFSDEVPYDDFGPRGFIGVRLFAETNTFDNLIVPRRGIALHASLESRHDVQRPKAVSLSYKTAAAIAIPLDTNQRVVLISRATLEGIFGGHPFYFMPTLGGGVTLRGYRQQQLAGEHAFGHSTDLRVDLVRFYTGLPSTMGVALSIDHGRVFGPSIDSNEYHMTYGGGVWFAVLEMIGVSLNYNRGLAGGSRFTFTFGAVFGQTGF